MEAPQNMNPAVRQNMNPAVPQNSLMRKNMDQGDLIKSRSDLMTRRLKNRERQRRYRARKRLEADMKKSIVLNQSPTTPHMAQLPNGNFGSPVARVYCKRDWKKDARKAFAYKGQDSMKPTFISATESQTSFVPSGNTAEAPGLIVCETGKPKLGRRDWKADARRKKS